MSKELIQKLTDECKDPHDVLNRFAAIEIANERDLKEIDRLAERVTARDPERDILGRWGVAILEANPDVGVVRLNDDYSVYVRRYDYSLNMLCLARSDLPLGLGMVPNPLDPSQTEASHLVLHPDETNVEAIAMCACGESITEIQPQWKSTV